MLNGPQAQKVWDTAVLGQQAIRTYQTKKNQGREGLMKIKLYWSEIVYFCKWCNIKKTIRIFD
jgi:hypothetical protein